MEIDPDIIAFQVEWLAQHRTQPRFIIVEEAAGWSVHQHTTDGVAPSSSYPTKERAAARVLQLLGLTNPVTPQNWPETVCVGEINGEPIDDEQP